MFPKEIRLDMRVQAERDSREQVRMGAGGAGDQLQCFVYQSLARCLKV